MNVEEFRDFCMAKKGVTEHFPFDDVSLVFKVMHKMFAISNLSLWERGTESVNLKCNPEKALLFRVSHEGITPGWHMNKRLRNTVVINNSDVSDTLLKELIDHSYTKVVKGFTKKLQNELKAL